MAKRRRKPARSSGYPGWIWMFFGLAMGLAVAAAIYVAGPRTERVEVASPPPALDRNSDTPTKTKKAGEPAQVVEEPARFVFYELLKKMEIEVESGDVEVAKDVAPRAVVAEGTYILQAGSFSRREDAERRRAELGFQGIESRVVAADVNQQRYFRVYIGPISDLDRLNLIRSQLRAAKIDVLRITVDQ